MQERYCEAEQRYKGTVPLFGLLAGLLERRMKWHGCRPFRLKIEWHYLCACWALVVTIVIYHIKPAGNSNYGDRVLGRLSVCSILLSQQAERTIHILRNLAPYFRLNSTLPRAHCHISNSLRHESLAQVTFHYGIIQFHCPAGLLLQIYLTCLPSHPFSPILSYPLSHP